MESDNRLPQLSPEEIRVLGSLIEKSRTTPDYYPMTINSLAAACNQKSSRNPVVEYDESTVLEAVNSLKGRSLVSTAVGGGSRALKYKHNITTVFPMSDAELAILCLLFLRGPLTPGEINSNSGRLYEFESLADVQQQLETLLNSDPPFVRLLPRRPGQKEARYIHLLQQVSDQTEAEDDQPQPAAGNRSLEERLSRLEQQVEELKRVIDQLVN